MLDNMCCHSKLHYFWFSILFLSVALKTSFLSNLFIIYLFLSYPPPFLCSIVMYVQRQPGAHVLSVLMDGVCPVCVCVCAVVNEKDPRKGIGYIACPDHFKNYCVHGECQFPSIVAQPSCRYTHSVLWNITGQFIQFYNVFMLLLATSLLLYANSLW